MSEDLSRSRARSSGRQSLHGTTPSSIVTDWLLRSEFEKGDESASGIRPFMLGTERLHLADGESLRYDGVSEYSIPDGVVLKDFRFNDG